MKRWTMFLTVLLFAMGFSALVGCSSSSSIMYCVDHDGDGYGEYCLGPDADDHNAAVHPGAPEICDGLDNNQNGIIDEGCGIAGGAGFTCSVNGSEGGWCWGSNGYGQIGASEDPDYYSYNYALVPVPVRPALTDTPVKITAQGWTGCALLKNGSVECWGSNSDGECGIGDTTASAQVINAPAQVVGLDGVKVLDLVSGAGGKSSCVLLNTGDVRCWGHGVDGELGNGDWVSRNAPVDVVNLAGLKVVGISSGDFHHCAILNTGAMKCWGYNSYGQLGNNDNTYANQNVPVDVANLPGKVVQGAAGYEHTCALINDGTVYCWGINGSGQLGDGTGLDSLVPVQVIDLPGEAVQISSGDSHVCALIEDRTVYCWGYNLQGELGDGTILNKLAPVQVISLPATVRRLASNMGEFDSCVLLTTGKFMCWGYNYYGQLGIGNFTDSNSPVFPIFP